MDSKETSIPIKKPVTLDSIPEDITSNIVQEIRSWADVEGSLDEREKARKARDSTLRAAALTSRKSLESWLPSLLKNVSVSMDTVPEFYEMLKRDTTDVGTLVESIGFRWLTKPNPNLYIFFAKASGRSLRSRTTEELQSLVIGGIDVAAQEIYDHLKNLKVLILEEPNFVFSSHVRTDPTLSLRHFLAHSLKTLYFLSTRREQKGILHIHLSGMNTVWLLLFCPHLEDAAIGLSILVKDLKLLSELSDTFRGMSRVQKLALDIKFSFKEPVKDFSSTKLNKKTTAAQHLLSVTNNLKCFELSTYSTDPDDVTDSPLRPECLSSLKRSCRSIKHLRLLGLGIKTRLGQESSKFFSTFSSLRVFTFDYIALHEMSRSFRLLLPSSIEIICLPFYVSYDLVAQMNLDEHTLLLQLIKSEALPNLKQVVIPSERIDNLGDLKLQSQIWAEKRRAFEKDGIFSGTIDLRTVGPGEIAADASKGEVFMSTNRWLSP